MSALGSFDVGDVVLVGPDSAAWSVVSTFREPRFDMLVTAQIERGGNVMTVDASELVWSDFVLGHDRWRLIESPPDVPPGVTAADMRWLEGRS